MKMIKYFSLALVTLFAFTASANVLNDNVTPIQEKKQLRAEVLKHIKAQHIKKLHTTARIKFMVTSQNEIVVLNVKTDERYVERMVKNQLNYKKVKTELSKTNQIYYIDITFDIG